MDTDRVIAELAARHHVMIDRHDPILMLGTVVELATQATTKELAGIVRKAADETAAASAVQIEAAKQVASRLITDAGTWIVDQTKEAMTAAMTTSRAELAADFERQRRELVATQRRVTTVAVVVACVAVALLVGMVAAVVTTAWR